MIQKITVEMIQNARDEIDNAFKLNNSELSIIPKSQREARDIINYALGRLNDYKVNVLDQYIHADTESSEIITTGSHPGNIDSWKEYEDQAKREGRDITGFGLKPTEAEEITKKCGPGEKALFKNTEGYKEFHKPIVIKQEEIYPEEEPELNEEAISKLCDDLIETKKEPLFAAQIIDKYARRD